MAQRSGSGLQRFALATAGATFVLLLLGELALVFASLVYLPVLLAVMALDKLA